jgi:hypothetical protein
VSCCGFEAAGNDILDIGELAHATVGDLLDKADDDLPLNIIAAVGPHQMMDRLREADPNLPFAESYSGICAVCHDLVTNPSIRAAFIERLTDFVPEVVAARRALRRAGP